MRRFSSSQEDVIGEGTGPKFANRYRYCRYCYLLTGGEITGAASCIVTMTRIGLRCGGFPRVPRNTDTHTTVHKIDYQPDGWLSAVEARAEQVRPHCVCARRTCMHMHLNSANEWLSGCLSERLVA